ncbi:alpha/beta-hydrolase family protein [Corynebacterium sp. p3-SID1194]|uniref:alpha/beta-hydrolase family protein n=1 Tax=Corynebacterium sp. p3-SID1194 TaxID=2916105 RepID=UPI0021A807B6|nr:alpha/beta-hydrolase family protein [Corynebacterium sp. p3-SID1194]MCT1450491.1 alpha/beta-hydrolase family protein [Corynebacterium sp. p3-SID1194]
MLTTPLESSFRTLRTRAGDWAESAKGTVKQLWPRRTHAVRAPLYAVELLADLTPVVRMSGLRRLPDDFAAGILGAEVAAWSAISPSLLPHPWWVTTANVAISQAAGHTVGVGVSNLIAAIASARNWTYPRALRRKTAVPVQIAMGTMTVASYLSAALRRSEHERLVEDPTRLGPLQTLAGIGLGSIGYGALLLAGEGIQVTADRFNNELRRWMPPAVSWPVAILGLSALGAVLTDKVVIRQTLNTAYRNADELNREFLPGATKPHEPERSGSPDSLERWKYLGRQGRAVVAGGPRKADLEEVLGVEAKEPIRVFIGLKDRSPEEQAKMALQEMDRTDAWSRKAIAVLSSAGTGWINDFHTSGFEFLNRGDCAIVAQQYSFMPSAYSYASDRSVPVRSSRVLINAIRERLAELPEDKRPRLYVGGESLGAYGVADSFDSVDSLLDSIDGGVFTGTPGFTARHIQLTKNRDHGSPEHLPVVDGGRHVRFTAHPDHLEHTFDGSEYEQEWQFPRAVFAQHASDPVVWWDWWLFIRKPDWLREPGSRGVKAPEAQHVDVLQNMRWVPFITGWQVGVDQLTSQQQPGGHGHQYHNETVAYWNAVLDAGADKDEIEKISEWIHADSTRIRANAASAAKESAQNTFSRSATS